MSHLSNTSRFFSLGSHPEFSHWFIPLTWKQESVSVKTQWKLNNWAKKETFLCLSFSPQGFSFSCDWAARASVSLAVYESVKRKFWATISELKHLNINGALRVSMLKSQTECLCRVSFTNRPQQSNTYTNALKTVITCSPIKAVGFSFL